jgi:hypothetical protein
LKPDLAMPAHTTGMIPATNTAQYEINIPLSSLGFFLTPSQDRQKSRKKSH